VKSGGGPGKGKGFERKVARLLSSWISKGKNKNLLWRSANSGSWATQGRSRGEDLGHQAGDICATQPEGKDLTDNFYIECKFRRSLDLDRFLFGEGRLAKYWLRTCEEAVSYKREPLLIAKQNFTPTLALVRPASLNPEGEAFGTLVRLINHEACMVLELEKMLKHPFRSMLRLQ
jgi:hypothetical protein